MTQRVGVFDFDGTLCEYSGWRGHDKIGKPIADMIELVRRLREHGDMLILSTTRLNPYPFGEVGVMGEPPKKDEFVENGYAYDCIHRWLKKQGIRYCFRYLTGYKPYADYYVDDRGIRYSPLEKDKFGGLLAVELYQHLLVKKLL